MSYVPLHLHSEYSVLESTLSIKSIVKRAKEYNLEALALTDFCNMFGAVDFYKACIAADIKPILGMEIMLAPYGKESKKKSPLEVAGHPLILLAKNKQGYHNLCKITSAAYLEGFYYYPRIDQEFLEIHSEGLICLTGPYYSKLSSLIISDNKEAIQIELQLLKRLFGEDLYFELSRHRMSEEILSIDGIDNQAWLLQKMEDAFDKQDKVNAKLIELSKQEGIPLVATNDVKYLDRDDWHAHEVLLNVSSGEPCEIWEKDAFGNLKKAILNPRRKTMHSHELYFKSPMQMSMLFSDIPEAISNTVLVAEKCNFSFDFDNRFYPVFVPPTLEGKEYTKEERKKSAEEYLTHLCESSIPFRYTEEHLEKVQEQYPDQDPMEVVIKRLSYELEIIISKEMGDYLLIVYDFIAWAKGKKIPVGPGRGSGAGSIILYLIGVTDIEPLRFNLFFERFINPERLSYPDIDVDICMERRPEVIRYTIEKYGRDNVAQIITFGTMKAKMAIKDVGRVLSIPLAKVNALAKLVPEDPSMTLENAISIDPDLAKMIDEDSQAKRIIDLAKKLEGNVRNTGVHAAGIIISAAPLTEHIPVCNSKDSEMIVTQYSMKPVEAVGMLKIDFLGLKTLTCIQKAVDAIALESDEEVIDWVNLPLDDKKTFELLNHGKTMGIFQLESSGMQDLARQLHIDKFEEIIAVGALYRPGPMEMIPSFIQRKHGKEKIEYDHEWLEPILNETYGIMVYQEQVMQMASRLAGYSLGEGDVLRRAMGKKDREQMGKEREKFREGAREKGIDEKLSMAIFDKVEKFASYGFNKSHAAAYGYLSYVTAYLKANYPGQWLSALMTCDMFDLSKVAKHIRECEAMKIEILPPNINQSSKSFVSTKEGIRFSLAAIKGVGESAVESIVKERNQNGEFISLGDFIRRMDTSAVGKKVMENLILAGCFDSFDWTRKALEFYLQENFDLLVREKKEKAKGIFDLFEDEKKEKSQKEKPPCEDEMPEEKLLFLEKELLGFYVTGHPLESYKDLIEKAKCDSLEALEGMKHGAVSRVAVVVDTCVVRMSQRAQKKFALLNISDGITRFELPIWPDLYEKYGEVLVENALLLAIVMVDKREDTVKLSAKWVGSLKTLFEEGILQLDVVEKEIQQSVNKSLRQEKKAKNEPEKILATLKANIELSKISMKKILHLKQVLRAFPGGDSAQLTFMRDKKFVANLSLDPSEGVKYGEEIKGELTRLPFVESVE